MKEEIAKLLEKKVKMTKAEIVSLLEIPKPELGDFAFPCFKLAAEKKKNPVQIAKDLEAEIKPKGNIEKIKAVGPYLNFSINKNIIFGQLFRAIGEKYGETKEGKGQTIVVDFSAPNIGKPMHVGHIRSTIIGDSLIRLYHYLGYKTIGINYLGDIGLHIGKLIVAYELWVNKKALDKDPVKELLRLYVKFNENEKSEFTEGQEEDYQGNEWTNKAREKLKLIELGDRKAHKIWEEIREKSGKGFDRVYKMLNVTFDETTGQSKFSEEGKKIISNQLRAGKAKIEKDGAVYIEFPNILPELPKKYLLKKDGTAMYITQDIAAAVDRNRKYKFDKLIYVVDYRQSLHFKQLFEILRIFGYDFYNKCHHVPFGTVNFGKEIMASREGKIVLLEDVLKKTIEKAEQEIKKRKTKGDPEKIGVGAIKYIILRNEPIKDVEFSWDVALNFEGATGPYIQYSYARASSIIKRAKKQDALKIAIPDKTEPSEQQLAKKILEFPDIIKKSASDMAPNLLANYSFSLSQLFNEFYHGCKVIGAEQGKEQEAFRLALVDAFRTTLKNALYLLGIEVMEEM